LIVQQAENADPSQFTLLKQPLENLAKEIASHDFFTDFSQMPAASDCTVSR